MTTTAGTGRPLDDKAAALASGMVPAYWAQRTPDRPAVMTAFGDRTFAELNANVNRLVRALRARGLSAGDAVALCCTNRPEFTEVVYATQRAGLRLTPFNWHLGGDEAAYIVENCEAKAFIASADLDHDTVHLAGSGGARRGDLVRLAVGGEIDGFELYDQAIGSEEGADVADPVLGTQMLYTSGTTGRPKGVRRNGSPSVLTAVNFCGYDEAWETSTDRHLCTGPLYHAAPLAFSLVVPMIYGVPIVVMDQWDPAETLDLIERHGITHTHMVPTMFHRLLALSETTRSARDLSSLRYVIHGAAPCPVEVKQQLIEWLGPIVVEYYAATEGVGSLVDSETWLKHPGTVGRPLRVDQVRIAGEDGNEVAAGQIGLVYLRADPATRFEYFGDAAKTAGAYRGEYFTLGDMGYLDDGYLYLTDRTADLIISGGVNIYPAEVDAVLLRHQAVADAATIGVPDPEWGESVKAVVELQQGHRPSTELGEELIDLCRSHLAHFKCPRSVDFTDRLPREDTGKIFKRKLRDQYRETPRRSGPAP